MSFKMNNSMRLLLFITFLLWVKPALGQVTFEVQDFSDEYAGKVHIEDTSEVFSKGWVVIYEKESDEELIKVESDELTFDLAGGKAKSNVQKLPYGEQSSILYEDVNFDGKKDLAIMDGQKSCYHGPSFKIYLATQEGFSLSPAFSRLAHEYCGMFRVDHEKEQIYTMTKSGCCWHQFSTFEVEGNEPYPVEVFEIGAVTGKPYLSHISKSTRTQGEMTTEEFNVLQTDRLKETEDIIYQLVFDNGKKMVLFVYGNTKQLYYAFLNNEDKVELFYSGEFIYSQRDHLVKFTREETTYEIRDDQIIVTTPEDVYHLKGKVKSKAGREKLRLPASEELENIRIEDEVQK